MLNFRQPLLFQNVWIIIFLPNSISSESISSSSTENNKRNLLLIKQEKDLSKIKYIKISYQNK